MNQRLRTDYGYNLHLLQTVECDEDFFQMPMIRAIEGYPEDLIGFNYVNTAKDFSKGVHFYLDDYQFERVWNNPERYLESLRRFDFVCTPDFSLYSDMPKPLQIYNTYRSRLLGAWWQSKGINVIPTLSWSDEDSFSFAFNGIEQNGIVTVSTVGVAKNKEARKKWSEGMNEMIKQVRPKTVLVYGSPIEFDFGEVEVIYYKNVNVERMKGIGR